jgi:chaperone modulatory protein CbpM
MNEKILSGDILDEQAELSLSDLCRACSSHAEWVIQLVEEGVLDPIGGTRNQWRFSAVCLQRARTARRLQQDLEINIAGVALALDLLDEIETLRTRLHRLGQDTSSLL